MIDKFMHGFLNRVYGYDDYTQLEINSKLIQKIDEVIEECNSAFEFVDWLKEQGVPDEVQTIIDVMLEDGTLEKLINIEKINKISSQLNSNIEQLTNETENKLEQMNTTMNTKIEENKALINQNKTELDTTIDNFEIERYLERNGLYYSIEHDGRYKCEKILIDYFVDSNIDVYKI